MHRLRHVALQAAAVLCFTNVLLGEVHVIEQINFLYLPTDIIVAPGDTIEWHWSGGNHPMSSGENCTEDGIYFTELPLDAMNPVATFEVPDDGTTFIPYFCIPHCEIDMVGTITIQDPGEVPAASAWGFVSLVGLLLAAGVALLHHRRRGEMGV